MKKCARFFLCFWVITGLTSCYLPARTNSGASDQEIARQYQTVSALLTETAVTSPYPTLALAEGLPTRTPSPLTDATETMQTTAIVVPPVPTLSATRFANASASQILTAPCDLAQPGRPIDITVPDDTRMYPGEVFSKTWRLVNAGTCEWAADYAVVWFSGDELGLNAMQPLGVKVAPGQSIDVTVDMIAPEGPGAYQSNWKMRNSQGMLFGIGPNGDAPFWTRINVVPLDTLTPTSAPPMPTVTETPVIFATGTTSLALGDTVDLDSGQLRQADNDDLALQQTDESRQVVLIPLNGARMAFFGVNQPELEDCLLSGVGDTPILLEQYQPGSYLCYRTTKGLPGRASITDMDLKKNQISLEYLTWSVP